jgi:hypothetical protein
MKPARFLAALALIPALAFLSGCVTHITMDATQNPPPAEKFANFTQFEIRKITLGAPYAGQDANERAVAKIQENVSLKADPLVKGWNATGAAVAPARTLIIAPAIMEIKFISGGSRFWGGALAGSSAVILTAKITEKETGKEVGSPTFYARAAAMGGAWTFGGTDNAMLVRIAGRLTDYLEANYGAAVGGPTGAEPTK